MEMHIPGNAMRFDGHKARPVNRVVQLLYLRSLQNAQLVSRPENNAHISGRVSGNPTLSVQKFLLPSSPFQHSTILGSPFLDFLFLRLSLGHSPFLQSPFEYFPHLGLSDFSDKDCFFISHELSASDGNKPLEELNTTASLTLNPVNGWWECFIGSRCKSAA
jgi:hypothetical protein